MMGSAFAADWTTSSLFIAREDSTLLTAISWIEGLLTGTLATMVAVIAVAALGFLLLQGRLVVRDGLRVLAGCFILFGASAIVSGIRAVGDDGASRQIVMQDRGVTDPLQIPENTQRRDRYGAASIE